MEDVGFRGYLGQGPKTLNPKPLDPKPETLSPKPLNPLLGGS